MTFSRKPCVPITSSGQPSASGQERYVWEDSDTDRLLEFDKQLNTGIFWMRSRRLDVEIKRLYPE